MKVVRDPETVTACQLLFQPQAITVDIICSHMSIILTVLERSPTVCATKHTCSMPKACT